MLLSDQPSRKFVMESALVDSNKMNWIRICVLVLKDQYDWDNQFRTYIRAHSSLEPSYSPYWACHMQTAPKQCFQGASLGLNGIQYL